LLQLFFLSQDSIMRFLQGLVVAFLLSNIHALPAADVEDTSAISETLSSNAYGGYLEKRDEYKDELIRCLRKARPANKSKLTSWQYISFAHAVLADWPHFNCRGKFWTLDSHEWKNAVECYNQCEAEIEAKIRRGEKLFCEAKEKPLARCSLEAKNL
jgi:phosphodiesterase/alkaline phosphatase D-like protein